MLPRLPLSVKILIWVFLNCVALAAGFVLLFNAQFHFDMNWFLNTSARERIDAMRNLITDELNYADPEEWERVFERFSAAYHVRFTMVDEDGTYLIGAKNSIPEEVLNRISSPPGLMPGRPGEFSPPSPHNGDDDRRWLRVRNLRMLVHTTNPSHYWLLMGLRLDNPHTGGGPMRVLLAADDSSLSMGGLIIERGPWVKLGVGAIAFSVLFWLPLLHGITRSIGKITHATQRIAEGQFDVRVSSRRRDELGSLAEAINQMAERLDGMVKGQKRFLGDVAHELCSPLARLQMALGIIEQHASGNQADYAKSASEKAEQIAKLVNALLAFSKASFGAQALRLEPVNVKSIVEKAIRGEAVEGVKIELEISGEVAVFADQELLMRALANLIRNAIRHNADGGVINVTAVRSGGTVAISIADSGPGVPEEELSKIFDAFYRVDTARTRETGGVGLGLAIVKTCVESCKGSVVAKNREPHGLEVSIRLPAADATSTAS